MATKTFNISMDEELVKKIDEAAKAEYTNRSDFIRAASLKALRESPISNEEALQAAAAILEKHKKDFKNLANR